MLFVCSCIYFNKGIHTVLHVVLEGCSGRGSSVHVSRGGRGSSTHMSQGGRGQLGEVMQGGFCFAGCDVEGWMNGFLNECGGAKGDL